MGSAGGGGGGGLESTASYSETGGRLTWYITAEGGVGAREAALAVQPWGLAPEVQPGILMLQGCNVVAICQQGTAEPHFSVSDVCLVVQPAATPQVQQVPQANPVQSATRVNKAHVGGATLDNTHP